MTKEKLKKIKEDIKTYFKDNPYFKGLNSYNYTYDAQINIFLSKIGEIHNFKKWLENKPYYNNSGGFNMGCYSKTGNFKHNCPFLIKCSVKTC